MRRDVFQAIADPVRRSILDLLVANPKTVNEVAAEFEISRPAISKHLKILQECGLVNIVQEGRERFCYIQAQNLLPAFLWLEQYQKLWEARLDSFETYLMELKEQRDKEK